MKITAITQNYYQSRRKNITDIQSNNSIKYSNPGFGYCDIHQGRMKTANENIRKTISQKFAEYGKIRESFVNYTQKLEFMKNAHQQVALLATQYANYQYSLAEVIPSYALESSSELMKAIEETQVFETPEEILLTIANIPKIETASGVDINTGKAYTQEQLKKSRASSQLYSTSLLLDLLDKKLTTTKLDRSKKALISNMRKSIIDSISSVYGVDAYTRIQKLKMMGPNASIEDKKASLNLLQEFDNIARDLDFGRDFYKNLDKLLKYQETTGIDLENSLTRALEHFPKVILHYHTHPQGSTHSHHEHSHPHTHTHEEMHRYGIEHTHDLEKKIELK